MADGSRVAVYVSPKPNGKTAIQVQHEKLQSADAIEPSRELWRGILELLLSTGPKS
jgi:hypothetical protein